MTLNNVTGWSSVRLEGPIGPENGAQGDPSQAHCSCSMRKSVMSPCNHGMRPMLRALVGFIIWAGASATHERLVLPEDLPAYT